LRVNNLLPGVVVFAFLFVATNGFAEGVNIVSPASDSTVSSPVRVFAEFPKNVEIASISISIDSAEIPQETAVTPLDINVPVPEGNHLLTVKGVQSDGTELSSSRWVNVSAGNAPAPRELTSTSMNTAVSTNTSTTVSATTYSSTNPMVTKGNVEEMTGWYTYPDQGTPTCSSKPTLTSSPSLDGISGKFYLGPNGQFQNCLWPILLGSNSSIMNFKLDVHYQLSNPAYPQGVEFSSNHHIGTKWYKFSVQCSYYKGIFSVWDTAGAKWSATSIPCKRPVSGSWDHLTVNTQIANGKAVFQSLTFNGVTHTINRSFYPITKPSSYSYGVHFQMDGNRAGNAYYTWVDQLTYSAW
jgi:hypothetical protein